MMKAIVMNKYGGPEVLEYRDVNTPGINDHEVLVKNIAAGVNPLDWKIRDGEMKLFMKIKFPAIPGLDIAGEVVKTGKKVSGLQVGDHVYGKLKKRQGGFAEYVAVEENQVSLKPANFTFEEAAALPTPALTALQALRDIGKIKSGYKVLVNGASGGVGIMAVQIAKSFGAHVTGTCSYQNMDLVKNAGADEVINYKVTDFTKQLASYHILFDSVATGSYRNCKKILSRDGIYITTLPGSGFFSALISAMLTSHKVRLILAKSGKSDLSILKMMAEEQKIKPYIDKIYQLADAKNALDYSKTGRVRGKIIIKI